MLQDAPAKLCSIFVSICPCELEQCRSRLYCDFAVPIKRTKSIVSSMPRVQKSTYVKMSSVVKQLLYVLKLIRVTAGCVHSFRIRSNETLRMMYPKCPVLDMIQRIHLRCG